MTKHYEGDNSWIGQSTDSLSKHDPKDKMRPDLDTIDSLVREVLGAHMGDEAPLRKIEVLAGLYQARALNEIAQSLYEIVRDRIGVKEPDPNDGSRDS